MMSTSIVALAIVAERIWSLQRKKIAPPELVPQIWQWYKSKSLDNQHIEALSTNSPLGKILAAGLVNRNHPRDIMKESIEEVGRQVAHELERFLNTLGTIATITPLLGLLGTVVGMISVFSALIGGTLGSPAELAPGISQALYTTAAGLIVAIPTMIVYRYFRGKVKSLIIKMEEEALKVVDIMHGDREASGNEASA